ncbi:Pik4cb protein [Salpingoeca rosetta]|uniref:1-phosphatidylinositol 4-kinase n=1 Tax=Salpingoeca rosetta (strain ATCC 50818 / BSB-021) TaxID=946362 RepID=F2USH5_SALR5|nr:Pik4cb protein [Salpingoeca rosetta]EGD81084.1 Pik4cb protein [Salpingoeca rosetta]|eukprot:XP_004987953.1 Pik4cb protein [Salpingoeca rosetta]
MEDVLLASMDHDVQRPASSQSPTPTTAASSSQQAARDGLDSMRRMVDSEMFTMHMSMHYLHTSKSAAIIDMICQRMCRFPPDQVEFYLPQIICMCLLDEQRYASLRQFVLDTSARDLHFALLATWLLQAELEGLEDHTRHKSIHVLLQDINSSASLEVEPLTNHFGEEPETSSHEASRTYQTLADALSRERTFVQKLLSISERLRRLPSRDARRTQLYGELARVNLDLPARAYLPLSIGGSNDLGSATGREKDGTTHGHSTARPRGADADGDGDGRRSDDEVSVMSTSSSNSQAAWRSHHVVRIPPEEAVVLNSKDRAPYMLQVEVVDCDDFYHTRLPAKQRYRRRQGHLRSQSDGASFVRPQDTLVRTRSATDLAVGDTAADGTGAADAVGGGGERSAFAAVEDDGVASDKDSGVIVRHHHHHYHVHHLHQHQHQHRHRRHDSGADESMSEHGRQHEQQQLQHGHNCRCRDAGCDSQQQKGGNVLVSCCEQKRTVFASSPVNDLAAQQQRHQQHDQHQEQEQDHHTQQQEDQHHHQHQHQHQEQESLSSQVETAEHGAHGGRVTTFPALLEASPCCSVLSTPTPASTPASMAVSQQQEEESSSGEGGNSGEGSVPLQAMNIRQRLHDAASTPESQFQRGHKDPSAIKAKENWADKVQRIRRLSPFGHHPKWRLIPVIIKSGDDLRQELLATQLLALFQKVWRRERVPLWIRPIRILVTSSNGGMIEVVGSAVSLHQTKKQAGDTLLGYFHQQFGPANSEGFLTAQQNFAESLAAYCIFTYLAQVKDRHNGNIMIDSEGHILHIDFGFFLSNSPGRNLGFETAPFKLLPGFVEVLGGVDSDMFRYFKLLLFRGFVAARKHKDEFVTVLSIMAQRSSLPCFTKASAVKDFESRFKMGAPDAELERHVNKLTEKSLHSLRTRLYDNYQYLTNGIL